MSQDTFNKFADESFRRMEQVAFIAFLAGVAFAVLAVKGIAS